MPRQPIERLLFRPLLLVLAFGAVTPEVAATQEGGDRTAAWTSAIGVLVGAAVLDEFLRQELAASPEEGVHGLARVGNYLGRGRLIATTVAGGYAAGKVLGLEELSRPAQNTFIALAAAGAVNGALKVTVGRERPSGEGRVDRFRPFNFDDRWQSFPSGHVVTAFALATSISEQSSRPWVWVVSYGGAGLVAWSRIHEDRHWSSDVVAGALVGTLTAHFTLQHLERRERRRSIEAREGAPRPDALRVSLTPGSLTFSLPTR